MVALIVITTTSSGGELHHLKGRDFPGSPTTLRSPLQLCLDTEGNHYVRVDQLRRIGRGVRAALLPVVLIGSAAYSVGAGWRDLVGLVPACQGEGGLVTCISGNQPSGLSWYGAAFAVVVWFALLRWSKTSVAIRVVARTVITVGTGMYAAELLRGKQPRALACYYSQGGDCLGYFQSLTPTQAGLGLLVGAAVAFALIPARIRISPGRRKLVPVGATAQPGDCA